MENINDISFPNLGITLSNVPDGFSVFGKEIRLYAIAIAIAVVLAILLADKEAQKTKQNPDMYMDSFLITVIPAILGARLYYVIFNWNEYKDNLISICYIWEGGLAIYGGVLAGIISLFLFSKVKKQNFGLVLDTWVPGLALGQAIGRWGNFFNRECFGTDADSLFAMRIPVEHIHTTFSSKVTVHTDSTLSYVQVHPTFLYESAACLLIFLILLAFRRKKKVHAEVFLLYAFLYGTARFIIEGMRADQLILGTIGGVAVPVSQVVAILFITLAVVLFIVRRYKYTNAKYLADEIEE